MVSSTGIPAMRSEWTNWHLLFASQPEPDLEFTEEDLDESMPPPASPMNSPKRSARRSESYPSALHGCSAPKAGGIFAPRPRRSWPRN